MKELDQCSLNYVSDISWANAQLWVSEGAMRMMTVQLGLAGGDNPSQYGARKSRPTKPHLSRCLDSFFPSRSASRNFYLQPSERH